MKDQYVMSRNETVTQRHKTPRTSTKKEVGAVGKIKGWPEATDSSKTHVKVQSTSRLNQV